MQIRGWSRPVSARVKGLHPEEKRGLLGCFYGQTSGLGRQTRPGCVSSSGLTAARHRWNQPEKRWAPLGLFSPLSFATGHVVVLLTFAGEGGRGDRHILRPHTSPGRGVAVTAHGAAQVPGLTRRERAATPGGGSSPLLPRVPPALAPRCTVICDRGVTGHSTGLRFDVKTPWPSVCGPLRCL